LSSESLSRNIFGDIPVISLDALPRRDDATPETAKPDIALEETARTTDPISGPDPAVLRSLLALDFGTDRARRHITTSARCAGNLVYLSTIGLIATAIIGVFFGVGFLLLVSSPTGTSSGSVARLHVPEARSPDYGLLPSPHGSGRSPEGKLGLVLMATPGPLSREAAPLPASRVPPAPDADGTSSQKMNGPLQKPDKLPAAAETLENLANDASSHHEAPSDARPIKGPRTGPVQSGALPDPISGPPGAALLTPATPRLSDIEVSELLTQGDAYFSTGDVTSARLFYERAAAAGDGRAALRLGATFDPAFLRRAGLRNVQGDVAKAQSWYTLAADLGAIEAAHQLSRVETSRDENRK
jgi:hypothetical protein